MGYIFDALTRSGSKPNKRKQSPPGDSQQDAQVPPTESTEQEAAATLKFPGTEASGPTLEYRPAEPTAILEESVQHEQPVARRKRRPASRSSWDGNCDERLLSITEPSSVIAEEYRAIRTGIIAKWENRRHLIHTITSATPQEGKTITSLNLGLCFSELRNRKTLVIEADLRLPQFKKLLSLPKTPGLVGVLDEGVPYEKAIVQAGPNELDILPAGGRLDTDAVQMLSSPAMVNLIKAVRQKYDHVVIDTPPVVELADAGIVGALSDDVLLIARMNRTPKALIQQAIRTLASYKAPVAGLIATDQSRHRQRYYYYRYGYRYQYTYQNRKAA